MTIQEKLDMNQEQLEFLYKLQAGEKEMQSHVDNLASNPFFHYHIQLDSVPTYFVMLMKKREEDIVFVKNRITELEELLWEDEEFVSQFNKD